MRLMAASRSRLTRTVERSETFFACFLKQAHEDFHLSIKAAFLLPSLMVYIFNLRTACHWCQAYWK